MKTILFLAIVCTFGVQSVAQNKVDNYSFFKLYVTNSQGEVLLVKFDNQWEIVGDRYNQGMTVSAFIKYLANDMGIEVKDVKLAALYTQRPETRSNPTLMHYYTATYVSGTIKTPAECTDIRWFKPADALAAIPYEIMKSVMVKIKENPGKVLGAAFETSIDPSSKQTKVKVVEDFSFLN
jgi:ADP-ribose pyrophosphatase YjhB (NUDIX family)